MAISVKALEKAFGNSLARTSQDPESAIAAIRTALVRFERGEQGRNETLAAINTALDGHGVESVQPEYGALEIAWYVNMGDTYDTTILFSRRTKRFYVTSWGDFYERSPEYRAYSAREHA